MAFSGNFMCDTFKKELLEAKHNFINSQHTFQIALYNNTAAFTNATPTALFGAGNNEIASSGSASSGYVSGGPAASTTTNSLVNISPSNTGNKSFTSFQPKTFTAVTVSSYGALLYNSTAGGGSNTANCVLVLDFGGQKVATGGDFQIVFPTANATSAVIRIE